MATQAPRTSQRLETWLDRALLDRHPDRLSDRELDSTSKTWDVVLERFEEKFQPNKSIPVIRTQSQQ